AARDPHGGPAASRPRVRHAGTSPAASCPSRRAQPAKDETCWPLFPEVAMFLMLLGVIEKKRCQTSWVFPHRAPPSPIDRVGHEVFADGRWRAGTLLAGWDRQSGFLEIHVWHRVLGILEIGNHVGGGSAGNSPDVREVHD